MAHRTQIQVGFNVQTQQLNKLKSSLQEIRKLKFSDIMKINNVDAKTAHEQLNKIRIEALHIQEALKKAFNTKLNTINIQTFNKTLKNTGTNLEQVYKEFKKAGPAGENAFRSLSSQLLTVNTQLKQSHTALDKIAQTFSNTVRWQAASTVINSFTRSIQQAWGYTKSLDTSLNDIRIVTGKSSEEMAKFAVQANNAAKELGRTTTDYTKASLIYAQQGLDDKEIAERAAVTLKAANVTGQSTDEVSEQLTAVWNGYKVTAEEAELYVDRLAAVAANSASNLQELSVGMGKVASAANLMGVNEAQLAAQLSTIISVTRQAPQSVGVALKTIYARIGDIKAGVDEQGVTLGRYTSKMAELGVNVLDANGKLRDMGSVIEQIGSKWGTMTREQQIYLTQTMAGQRQYNNLLALFDNFEHYNKMLGIAESSMGTLQNQQDIYMDSLQSHLNVLKASLEDVYDSLFNADSMKDLIDGLSSATGLLTIFVDAVGGGGDILKSLGAIAMVVFGRNIAQGLNTTISNIQVAREQTNQFDIALKQIQEFKFKDEKLNEATQKIINMKEEFLSLARHINEQQFKGLNTLFDKLVEEENQVTKLEAELKNLEEIEKRLAKVAGKAVGGSKLNASNLSIFNGSDIQKAQKYYTEGMKRLQQQASRINDQALGIGTGTGKKNQQFFLNQIKELEKSMQSLEQQSDSLTGKINKVNQAINNIGDNTSAERIQEIKLAIIELTNQVSTGAEADRNALAENFEEGVEIAKQKLKQLLQAAGVSTKKIQELFNETKRAITIENVVGTIGGLGSIAMGVQMFESFGETLKSDEAPMKKFTSSLISLSMAFAMLHTGLKGVIKSLEFESAKQAASAIKTAISVDAKKAKAAILALESSLLGETTAGLMAHAAAEMTQAQAAQMAAAAEASLASARMLAAGIVITAVIAGIAAYVGWLEKERKQKIENAKAEIEQANAKQEQIEKNEQLYNSIEQLNDKYKKGQITRSNLESQVNDLIKQYDLESQKVKELTSNYGNLQEALKNLRQAAAEEKLESAKNELDNAKIAAGSGSYTEKSFRTMIGWMSNDQLNKRKLYEDKDTDFIANDKVNRYEELTSELEEYTKKGKLTEAERKAYNTLKEEYNTLKEEVQPILQAQKDVASSIAEVEFANFNFQGITNITDYMAQKQALINQIKEGLKAQGDTTSDAIELAENALRQGASTVYQTFNTASDYIEKLKTNLREGVTPEIEKMIGELTPESIDFLNQIKLDDIGNWKELKSVIEYLQTADLSGLRIVTDAEGQFEAASEQYDQYASLADQIKSSKKQTISKKEFESLDEEIQKFFTRMANGTYKMTGDAEEFYDTVNNKSLEGFRKNIQDLQGSSERLQKLQGINYDDFKSAGTSGGDWNYINTQLDYLTEAGYDLNKIIAWKAELGSDTETWSMTESALKDIAAAMQEVGNQTDNFTKYLSANEAMIYQNQLAIARSADSLKELRDFYENGEIAVRAFSLAALELDQTLDLEGLDSEELKNYSEHLQQIAEKTGQLSDQLKENAEAAEIVAKGIMKMNDAIDTLADNWEEWLDIFTKSSDMSEEYSQAMSSARQTIADLLDISKEYVSEDFIKDHLDEITAAASGSETAIDSLKESLADSVILKIIVENGLESEKSSILNSFYQLQNSIPDMQVGATLEDEAFLANMQQFLMAIGATVDQANAIFDSLGFEATFRKEAQPVEQRVPITVTKTEQIGETSGTYLAASDDPNTMGMGWTERRWSYPILKTITYNDGFATETGYMDVVAMATNGKTPEIESITKKASGSASNYSSKNAGGKSPGSSSSSKKSSNKSSSKKDTKDTKSSIKDSRDPYHDINIQLDQTNKKLQRLQKQQDRLYGKDLLNNLNKQSTILQQQKEQLKQKYSLQQQNLALQKSELQALGVTFDAYGNISNYMGVVAAQQNHINALISQYNALIEQYNNTTDDTLRSNLNDRLTQVNKRIEQAQSNLKDLQDQISNYDKLKQSMEDVLDEIEDATQKEIEINIKKFRMELEIRLEMGEAERDWNQFKRKVINGTDLLKDTDFSKIYKDAKQNFENLSSYFSVEGDKGAVETLTNQLNNTMAQIVSINSSGWSDIYGDNKQKAMEDMQSDLEQLMSQLEAIKDEIDNIDQAYLDTVEDVSSNFKKQEQNYEFISDAINHNIDLLQLLYGDENYNAMNSYYEQLEKNQLKELSMLRQEEEFWKKQWEDAQAAGDMQLAQKFEQKYKEALSSLNNMIIKSAEIIQQKYINSINKIWDELTKKLTNGLGTDYLQLEWDLINKNADEYLDTINAAFELQKLESKFDKAAKENENIAAQQALNKLKNEQLKKLKAKEKLTQYDIDRAEKLLQIEQAKFALEEAQKNKTSLRLKRDTQGNYSYQYTADQNKTAQAQNNLDSLTQDLYNFDLDHYKQNLNDILAAYLDFQQKMKEIDTDKRLSDEQKEIERALLQEQLGEYLNQKTADNQAIRENLIDSSFKSIAAIYDTDVANYQNMSEKQQEELMQRLVPTWNNGIQQMTNKFAGNGGFLEVCQDSFQQITDTTKDYEDQLNTMAEIAEIDLNEVSSGVNNVIGEMESLTLQNERLMETIYEEMDAMQALKAQVESFMSVYEAVYNAAVKAVSAHQRFLQSQRQQAASAASSSGSSGGSTVSSNSNKTASASGSSSGKDGKISVGDVASFTGQYYYDSWGSKPLGSKLAGIKDAVVVDILNNNEYGVHIKGAGQYSRWTDLGWIKRSQLYGYDTGGYTGSWGTDGKLALLHEKELVLNKEDTQNLLNTVNILRNVMNSMNGNLNNKINMIGSAFSQSFSGGSNDIIEQNVHIEASFPNVNSKKEIEEAFSNLVNLATQRVLRR